MIEPRPYGALTEAKKRPRCVVAGGPVWRVNDKALAGFGYYLGEVPPGCRCERDHIRLQRIGYGRSFDAKRALMTVLVLALVAVLVILVLPLFGLAAVMVAISLVVHAALGITAWLVGGQLLVAGLIFAGAILAGVYYGRHRPIDR